MKCGRDKNDPLEMYTISQFEQMALYQDYVWLFLSVRQQVYRSKWAWLFGEIN
jgi:hypothetical protein